MKNSLPLISSGAVSTTLLSNCSRIMPSYSSVRLLRSRFLIRLEGRRKHPSLFVGRTGWLPPQGKSVSYHPSGERYSCFLNYACTTLWSCSGVSGKAEHESSWCPPGVSPYSFRKPCWSTTRVRKHDRLPFKGEPVILCPKFTKESDPDKVETLISWTSLNFRLTTRTN